MQEEQLRKQEESTAKQEALRRSTKHCSHDYIMVYANLFRYIHYVSKKHPRHFWM